MNRLPISVAFWNYDRTLPLVDGRVAIEGCDARYHILRPEEAFARAFGHAEFDVTELSFSNYMTAHSRGTCAYAAVPVFPSRTFRHASIYIRADRGIERPEALAGRLVGLSEYEMTAALVVRGLLRDEYGVKASSIRWRVGDVERPERGNIPRPDVPAEIEVEWIGEGKTLDGMLAAGELDALIGLVPPPSFRRGDPNVIRLFPDWRAAERTYFRKTGIFPIMHTVGIRKSLLADNPWLATNVYKAFVQAKAIAMAELEVLQAPKVSLPWVVHEYLETKALMGEDFWPYGVRANRRVLETLIRYSQEDGLVARPLVIEELFARATLDT